MSELKIGLIGGTGLGDALGAEKGHAIEIDTPFGKPSSPIVQANWQGVDICILQRHGPGHVLSPSAVPYRANLFALKSLGVTHIVASGATGSLREDIHPGDLVIVDQIIDKTHKRANTFYEKAAVHVEFAEPFCPVMRSWLLDAARRLSTGNLHAKRSATGNRSDSPPSQGGAGGGSGAQPSSTAGSSKIGRVHDKGCYVCMEGPAFSTRAESHMHRAWGGDLIGMTAMPEAKLAREAEIAYALIGLPTDYDCWRPPCVHDGNAPADLLSEILGNLKRATDAGIALIKAALADVNTLRHNRSPAHNALTLAIWSDKKRIDPAEVKRLSTLWGRHF